MITPASNAATASDSRTLELWYRQPAAQWTEALPVGNGALGAMIFGGVLKERIQLNHEAIWTAGPQPQNRVGAHAHLPEIRRLLFAHKYAEAESLVERELLGDYGGGRSHQTLGDLHLTLRGDAATAATPENYRRSLDLDTGVATTRFDLSGVTFTREVFASFPDRMLVVELSASVPGAISIDAALQRPGADVRVHGSNTLVMTGTAQDGNNPPGVKFDTALQIITDGGTVAQLVGVDGGPVLRVSEATRVWLLFAAETDYQMRNPAARLPLKAALDRFTREIVMIDQLKLRAAVDHARLMRRVDLKLSAVPAAELPTDERLAAVRAGGDDAGLVELYFQYGRHLLIGSSRPGDMPGNLQGIWNEHMHAPWSADYHININIQMNYWPAEVTNLSECHEPFFSFIESLAEVSARRTAQEVYGVRGAVAHYTTDAWLGSSTAGKPQWAMWAMGYAWSARHFMEHFNYTGDREFLAQRAMPVLRDAALFMLDWLVEDPGTGKLVSGPTASPENTFIGADGKRHSVTMGCAMDQEIAWEVFTNYLEAARELGGVDELVPQIEAARARLAWPCIGKDGRLMEWAEELPEAEPGHRHLSHLYGMHPANQFTPQRTPEYMAAARRSIEHRLAHGGGHTGWSRAWIINFWARFRDAEKALENIQALLAKSTLPNLFDDHPPFQIDGNFGATAGIAEMLLQSHDGEVHLLPALPKSWSSGHFTGLMARGGFEVSAEWTDGVIERVLVRTHQGKTGVMRCGDKTFEIPAREPGSILEFTKQTLAGK